MRPLSVTIVGWWLIVTSLWGAYSSATIGSDPVSLHIAALSSVPVAVQQVFGVINGLVLALCGIAALKGYWWTRGLFLVWSVIGFIAGVAIIGVMLALLFSGLSVGLIMFFLSRPRANEWFSMAA